jgi:cytochrome subunit of sulfide dehydrogenase
MLERRYARLTVRLSAQFLFALLGSMALMLALSQSAHAQDAALEVRLLAASCATCHGHQGKALGVGISLQGQTSAELYRKLTGYKSGEIKGTIMHQHARGYSDVELKSMADYFAAFK